jgi:hypothetical protein
LWNGNFSCKCEMLSRGRYFLFSASIIFYIDQVAFDNMPKLLLSSH